MPDQPRSQIADRPVVIGLAGGVGAGKSAAARVFEECGARHLDADADARAALDDREVRRTLVEWWGEDVLDDSGSVDRRRVADIVFQDPEQRRYLEALLHPIVIERHERDIARARAEGAESVVIDAPLLFEAGLDRRCDVIVFVDAPRKDRLRRVREARGWSDQELARRENSQRPLENKRSCAHYVLDNDAGLDKLQSQARDLYQEIMRRLRGDR